MASNTDDIKNDSEWISFTSSPLNCFTFSCFRGSPNLWKPKCQILSVLNQNTSCLFSHSYETAYRMKRKNLGFGVSPHLGLNPVHCVCCMPACMLSAFSRVRLLPYGLCSPPGSSVHGILQARILKWVVMPSSIGSFDPGIKPTSPSSGSFFATEPPG